MLADGDINLSGLSAIVFRNAGTATVNLWYGAYTLDPKETLSLNVTTEGVDSLDLLNVPVTFDVSSGTVKKLQIVTLKSSLC